MSKSLQDLQKIVDNFNSERGWNHTSPNSLIAAIVIEVGELAENYQWQHEFKELSEEEKTEIGYEFMDILFYLMTLANRSDIDLEKYFLEKLPKLEKKFPVGVDPKKRNKEYRENGKNKLYD